jgi:uncharacterized membrane protein
VLLSPHWEGELSVKRRSDNKCPAASQLHNGDKPLIKISDKRGRFQVASKDGFSPAGLALGAGIAGSVDGILLHQLLQWHHVIMMGGPPVWMFTDGLFHTLAVSLLVWGTYMLWRTCKLHLLLTDRQMQANLLVGAGGFNLLEGIIDHHLLQIHHVKPGPHQLSWDLLYLAIAAVLLVWGLRLKQVTT